jgi:hypothetical protein
MLCAGRDAVPVSTGGIPAVRKVQLSTTKPPSPLLALSDDTSRPTNMNSEKRTPRPAASEDRAGVRGCTLAWLRNTSRRARRAS